MSNSSLFTVLAVTIFLGGCAHVGEPRIDTSKALEHFHLEDHEHSKDYQAQVQAQKIDPATFKPVPLLADIKMNGQPMLWLNPDGKTVVLDDQAFTDLKVVRAHWPRKVELIGRFVGDNSVSRRDLVKVLIKSDILSSNLHVSAEVYLMQETSDNDGYSCQVYVVDPYWTNEKNVNYYHYIVRISKNGEIRLAPASG